MSYTLRSSGRPLARRTAVAAAPHPAAQAGAIHHPVAAMLGGGNSAALAQRPYSAGVDARHGRCGSGGHIFVNFYIQSPKIRSVATRKGDSRRPVRIHPPGRAVKTAGRRVPGAAVRDRRFVSPVPPRSSLVPRDNLFDPRRKLYRTRQYLSRYLFARLRARPTGAPGYAGDSPDLCPSTTFDNNSRCSVSADDPPCVFAIVRIAPAPSRMSLRARDKVKISVEYIKYPFVAKTMFLPR